MEIITDIEQGSEEWHELRYGWVTASKFKDVMASGRGGAESKTRKAYMLQLAAECLSDMRVETYTNEYMEWGTQAEPQARSMYEFESGNRVDQVAFIRHGTLKVGCSPDGLIGDGGMIEIKCPKSTTQIETFLSGDMPSQHKPQVQGQLWVSGREWCDFLSFDPRINGKAGYFLKRVHRDDDYIKKIEQKVCEFCTELFDLIEELK